MAARDKGGGGRRKSRARKGSGSGRAGRGSGGGERGDRSKRDRRSGRRVRLGESVLRALTTGGPLAQRALAKQLGLAAGRPGGKRLERELRRLEAAGAIERRGSFVRLARKDGLVEAEFTRDRDGSAFAIDSAGRRLIVSDDGGAHAGDRVALLLDGDDDTERHGRRTASVVQVVTPSGGPLAGVFTRGPRGGLVEVLAASPVPWLRVARDQSQGAEAGELVVASPASRGASREPWARVIERLGLPGDPDADFRAEVVRHRLPVEFSQEAEEEADEARNAKHEEDDDARHDSSDRPFVTIDPASARDHDDAVLVERSASDDSLRLWVAIADVSSFVRENGALDREALRRGNSVYFPDRAIPMLPHALSSDACSLVEGEERRALVAAMTVRADGAVRDVRLESARIRSHARLTYEQAADLFDGGTGGRAVSPSVRDSLHGLRLAAERLRTRRAREGSLDLDLPETRILLDENQRPEDAAIASRTEAHRAIEDAMLAANRAVAERLLRSGVPAIFRIHEPPGESESKVLRARLERLGLLERGAGMREDPLRPEELAEAMERAASPETQAWLQMLVLRSMTQARYSAENRGHFALGFSAYCHFTSPIRRYADLVVHRAVRRLLGGRGGLEAEPLPGLALRLSVRERVAQRAEREIVALKVCGLMAERIGESFPGHVTSVANHGLYVRIEQPRVEGFVPASDLPGNYRVDADEVAMVCEGSGARIAVGDPLEVRLDGITPARGWLRFGLSDSEPSETRRKGVRGDDRGRARSGKKRPARPKPGSKGRGRSRRR